ncbi:hypothetical protein AQUSIP_24580 [Aquicella siphonis]|uniref:Uncharacterized protein n=1 Tax=Aquicella siphonis TaxID=254247 RepID=A0A5E4PL44_9COXI|nr:hypothetical protein AQUSIP_24580 [Aquicella siphonis]
MLAGFMILTGKGEKTTMKVALIGLVKMGSALAIEVC